MYKPILVLSRSTFCLEVERERGRRRKRGISLFEKWMYTHEDTFEYVNIELIQLIWVRRTLPLFGVSERTTSKERSS